MNRGWRPTTAATAWRSSPAASRSRAASAGGSGSTVSGRPDERLTEVMGQTSRIDCIFCRIRDGELPAHVVLDEPDVLAFLDARPVFPGHVLVIPRVHYETLPDLPTPLLPILFGAAQRMAVAVPAAMSADGTFVAINNVV